MVDGTRRGAERGHDRKVSVSHGMGDRDGARRGAKWGDERKAVCWRYLRVRSSVGVDIVNECGCLFIKEVEGFLNRCDGEGQFFQWQ